MAKFKKGDKRPAGAGKPKGFKAPATLEKLEHEAAVKELIRQHAADMTGTQIAHAKGVSYLRLRLPDGSFSPAKDEKQIDAAIAAGAHWFQIFTQAPHTPAYIELMARAFGKPNESMDLTIKNDPATMDDTALLARLAELGVKVR